MAVRLRLTRGGRKDRPHYRLVAMDQRTRRDGRSIEFLGQYDPMIKTDNFTCNKERVEYWLSVGAEPSETVRNFLVKQGVTFPEKTKRKRKKKSAK